MRISFIITILLLSLSQTACVASTPINAATVASPPVATPSSPVINNNNNGKKLLEFRVKNLTNAQIYIADRLLMARVNQGAAMKLMMVEDFLWRNHSNIYLRQGDYNRDGLQDLAILSSISYGGSNPCYQLFYFNNSSQRFIMSQAPLLCNP